MCFDVRIEAHFFSLIWSIFLVTVVEKHVRFSIELIASFPLSGFLLTIVIQANHPFVHWLNPDHLPTPQLSHELWSSQVAANVHSRLVLQPAEKRRNQEVGNGGSVFFFLSLSHVSPKAVALCDMSQLC